MVASSGGVANRVRWDISFFLAQTRLASSGQVHHVRQRQDARLHMEVGPRIHRRNQAHITLPPNAKRGYKTHTSARRILEELGSEEDKGRTHRRLDFLSPEAPRARPGTEKPPFMKGVLLSCLSQLFQFEAHSGAVVYGDGICTSAGMTSSARNDFSHHHHPF